MRLRTLSLFLLIAACGGASDQTTSTDTGATCSACTDGVTSVPTTALNADTTMATSTGLACFATDPVAASTTVAGDESAGTTMHGTAPDMGESSSGGVLPDGWCCDAAYGGAVIEGFDVPLCSVSSPPFCFDCDGVAIVCPPPFKCEGETGECCLDEFFGRTVACPG